MSLSEKGKARWNEINMFSLIRDERRERRSECEVGKESSILKILTLSLESTLKREFRRLWHGRTPKSLQLCKCSARILNTHELFRMLTNTVLEQR